MDEKVLLQVYFYKTYLYQQGVARTLKLTATKSTEGFTTNVGDKRYKTAFEWFYMYSPELLNLFTQLQTNNRPPRNRKQRPKSSRQQQKVFLAKKGRFSRRQAVKTTFVTTRPQHSVNMCNHFFTYFLLHFFKLQAIILAKSLYKAVTANALFKHEHQVLLYRTRFLKWHR